PGGRHAVVAVLAARARALDGRQVQVGDPELVEVGHQLAHVAQPEAGAELDAVGGPQPAFRAGAGAGSGASSAGTFGARSSTRIPRRLPSSRKAATQSRASSHSGRAARSSEAGRS